MKFQTTLLGWEGMVLSLLQQHLHALYSFCADKDLSINVGKTRIMMFNTTQDWITRSQQQFLFGAQLVEYTTLYVYLGVTFNDL